MFQTSTPSANLDKADIYSELRKNLSAILSGERDFIANMANTAAMLFHTLPNLELGWVLFAEAE